MRTAFEDTVCTASNVRDNGHDLHQDNLKLRRVRPVPLATTSVDLIW